MSMVFAREAGVRQKLSPSHSTVQKLLDENAMLIQTIADYQNVGRLQEAVEYQQTLHRNLVYLANLADGAQALLAELQAPFDSVPVSASSQIQNVPVNGGPEGQGFPPPDKENRPPPPATTQQYSNSDQMRSQQMSAMHNMPAGGATAGGNGYYGENQHQAHVSQQPQVSSIQQQPVTVVAPGSSGAPQMGGQAGQQQSMPQPVSIGYSVQMPMGPPPQQAPTSQQQQQQPPQSYYQQPYQQQQQQMVGPPAAQQQQQAYQPGPQTYQTARPQASGGPIHGGDSAAVYYSGQPRYQQQPGVTQQHSMHMAYQQQAPGVYQQAPVGPGPAMYGQQVRAGAGGYPQQQPQYGQQMGPPGAPPEQQQMYGHPAYHGAQVYHAYQQQQQPQQHMAPPPQQQQQQQSYSNMPSTS